MSTELHDSRGAPVLPRLITHLGDGSTPLTNRDLTADILAVKTAVEAMNAARPQVKHIDLQHAASLAPGATEQDDYTVPAGKSWLIRSFAAAIAAPAGAGSGSHAINVTISGTYTAMGVYASKAYNAGWDSNSPTDLRYLAAGAGRFLRLWYTNNTDVDQTNPRNWQMGYIEEVN